MARCGLCVHYEHHLYYNWSDDSNPFITSMTICSFASDGFTYRGENCVPCSNYQEEHIHHSFFSPENAITQLTLF